MSYLAAQPPPASRRVIDVAVGVIVGRRRCSQQEAFAEIAHMVHRTGVPLSKVAAALVRLASAESHHSPESAALQPLWADLWSVTGRAEASW